MSSARRFSPVTSSAQSAGTDCRQCQCCRARAAALEVTEWDAAPGWNSPLTPGILPENLVCTVEDRSVRIALWSEWRRMFARLQRLGPLRLMTMNRSVALEQWRPWPELHWSEDGQRAVDEEGDLDFDFRGWAQTFARHRRSTTGHVFSVECHDSDDVCFHRICLTPQSPLEAFSDWVRTHQQIPEPAMDRPEIMAESAGREPIGQGEWRETEVDIVRRLLDECRMQRLPLRAIAGTTAAVQSARFLPLHANATDGWNCCIGENTSLHFQPGSFSQVRMHDLSPGGVECWTLRAYDEGGCLVLMLMPASRTHLPAWNDLLHTLA